MDNKQMMNSPKDRGNISIQGHIKIYDPISQEVFINKRNAIHFEHFSIALAQSISNQGEGFISEMAFGNGGTRIDPTGIITYLTPNNIGSGAQLYNKTYGKIVDSRNSASPDPARNFMEVRHRSGTYYSDVLVSCLLDFGEPTDQMAFDNASSTESSYVFDELGLMSSNLNGSKMLLTHVIFHPVQKSLNRMIQIDYTVRIQSLSTTI